MRLLPIVGLSLAAAVIVGACNSGTGSGASSSTSSASPAASAAPSTGPGDAAPGPADLAGRVFVVAGVTGHDIVAGSEITLTFGDGRLGVSAGCNHMSGSFDIERGLLVIGQMATTEMACAQPLMAQDAWISTFLPGASVRLAGDTLTLARGDVTLTAKDRKAA